MYQINKELSKEIMQTLDVFGTVKVSQLKEYLMRRNPDLTGKAVDVTMMNMRNKGHIFMLKNDCVSGSCKGKRRMEPIVTLWSLMEDADIIDGICKAGFPAEYIFKMNDELYRVTICTQNRPPELAIYKDRWRDEKLRKQESKFTEFIIGRNLKLSDIDEDFLPERKFMFAEYKADDVFEDYPDVSVGEYNGKATS